MCTIFTSNPCDLDLVNSKSTGHGLTKTNQHVEYNSSVIKISQDGERKPLLTKRTLVTLTFDLNPKSIQYKLKRCSNKEYCKQCRYVKFKGTMTKWPVQKLTHRTTQKHVQHHDATDVYKNYIFVFFGFFFFYFLFY